MDGTDWEDARRVAAPDEHDAAESFAQWQCNTDSETYNAYETGKHLEVRFYATDQSNQAAEEAGKGVTESTLVGVTVTFDPRFHSRVERKIKDCAHPRLNEAPILVASATHYTRKCPDCLERVSTDQRLPGAT